MLALQWPRFSHHQSVLVMCCWSSLCSRSMVPISSLSLLTIYKHTGNSSRHQRWHLSKQKLAYQVPAIQWKLIKSSVLSGHTWQCLNFAQYLNSNYGCYDPTDLRGWCLWRSSVLNYLFVWFGCVLDGFQSMLLVFQLITELSQFGGSVTSLLIDPFAAIITHLLLSCVKVLTLDKNNKIEQRM